MRSKSNRPWLRILIAGMGIALLLSACASDTKNQNRAKEAAARFWSDKAYPGKAYDVQVIEAEKTDDGQYRVKGIVDGETRVGTYDLNSETFSEGYYSLAHEREKRVAELEQEVKYWKEKAEDDEKDIYKMQVQLAMLHGDMPSQGQGGNSAAPAAAAPAAAAAQPAAKPPTAPAPKP